MSARLYALAIVVIAAVVAVDVACARVPLTAPTASTITLSADQTTLPVNGQAVVRAVVIESAGTPVQNGTQVVFSTTLGSFNPPEATTVNGIATTTFMAGALSGTTRLNAFSGGASTGAGNSSGGGVEIKIGAAAAGSVSLQVTPPTVPQNGGTVTATALVLDPAGNPMRGVPVQFSADAGTISNANVVTDSNGYAVTNLVTTRAATITARVGTATPATFQVAVSAAPTVAIEITPTAPVVNQPVSIKVTPSTSANTSPVASVLVDFGDGFSQTVTGITGSVGLTHIYTRAGGYTVTATATDINGGRGVSSASVVIGFESLPTVSISGTPNPVSSSGTAQGVVTFTLTATAATTGGAPIRSVRATLQDGTVIYSGTGSSTFAYKFGGSGTYTVTASATDATGSTATTSTVIVVTP